MKKVSGKLKVVFLMLIMVVSNTAFSQKIAEDYVDEFTKDKIIRTSWEKAISKSDIGAYIRFERKNDTLRFNFKFMLLSVFSMPPGENLMIMLDNTEVIKLTNTDYHVSCIGCGATGFAGSKLPGLDLLWNVDKEFVGKLKNHKIKKIRIYLRDGYMEEEVKEKFAIKIQQIAALI